MPVIPYVTNIPQPTDQISVSQGQLLINTDAVDAWVGVNHVGFNVNDGGKHTFVALTDQTGTPNPFIAPEIGLYNKVDAVTTFNQLFVSYRNSAGTRFNYPITASIITNVPTPANASNGWAYLPSGIIIKWGQQSLVATGTPIVYPVSPNIPVFTQVFQVIISSYQTAPGENDPIYLRNINSVAQFTVTNPNATAATVCYLAIGY